mgnify:CR=1 FL=1
MRWIIFALAVWGIIAGFVLPSLTVNNIIIGIIIAVLGLLLTKTRAFAGWVSFILGLWWLISGIVIKSAAAQWNNFIVGIVLIIVVGLLYGKPKNE